MMTGCAVMGGKEREMMAKIAHRQAKMCAQSAGLALTKVGNRH